MILHEAVELTKDWLEKEKIPPTRAAKEVFEIEPITFRRFLDGKNVAIGSIEHILDTLGYQLKIEKKERKEE